MKMMRKIQTENIESIAVKQEALDDIYGHFDEFHRDTVWQEECRSWFKDGKIKNRIYLWPGSVSWDGDELKSQDIFLRVCWTLLMHHCHRRFISSRPSRIHASRTTRSSIAIRTDSHISATGRSRPIRRRVSRDWLHIFVRVTMSGTSSRCMHCSVCDEDEVEGNLDFSDGDGDRIVHRYGDRID